MMYIVAVAGKIETYAISIIQDVVPQKGVAVWEIYEAAIGVLMDFVLFDIVAVRKLQIDSIAVIFNGIYFNGVITTGF